MNDDSSISHTHRQLKDEFEELQNEEDLKKPLLGEKPGALLRMPQPDDYLDQEIVIEMAPDVQIMASSGIGSKRGGALKQSFNQQMRRIFIPQEDRAKTSCCWRLCCCCYYLFCCCICESNSSMNITKKKFVSRFQKWVHIGGGGAGNGKGGFEDPLTLLIRLYAHDKSAIDDLEQVRVNPDYTSQFRTDLEFYIPQLCSFYLRGDSEDPQKLVNLLVMASTSSFFFSHRIWFYFQSMLFNVEDTDGAAVDTPAGAVKEQYKRTRVALNGIRDACSQASKERLYLSNSTELIQLLKDLKLIDQYPVLYGVETDFPQPNHLDIPSNNQSQGIITPAPSTRSTKVKQLIEDYIVGAYQASTPLMSDESHGGSLDRAPIDDTESIRIIASDIVLKPFQTVEEQAETPKDEPEKVLLHNALTSYLSTPKFVMALTEISLALINVPDRAEYLRTELTKLNRCLPGSVYIPFVNSSMRNYAVLHIVVKEAKVFQTKERAPLLLCIEVYRPDELYLVKDQQQQKKKQSNNYLRSPDDLLASGDYENIRANSWHSSQQHAKGGPLTNPYLTRQQQVEVGKKGVKRQEAAVPVLEGEVRKPKVNRALEVSKQSDIKASNPLIISEIKRNDSNLMEKVKVSEIAFQDSMRQASNQFQAVENMKAGSHSEMQAIMEVEDAVGGDEEKNNQYFSYPKSHRRDSKEDQMVMQVVQDHHNITSNDRGAVDPSLQNTYRSQDQTNFLARAIGAEMDEDATNRYSNLTRDKSMFKSYGTGGSGAMFNRMTGERKESGDLQQLNFLSGNQIDMGSSQKTLDDAITVGRPLRIESIEEKRDDEEDEEAAGQNAPPVAQITEAQLDEENEDQMMFNANNSIKRSQSMRIAGGETVQGSQHQPSAVEQQLIQEEGFHYPQSLLEGGQIQHRPSNAAFYDAQLETTIYSETSKEQDERVRKNSPFGSLKTWKLLKIIVKSNDDVRQEQFAMQLISQIDQIFKLKKLPLWLKPYEILATGQRCGLIELVSDALSIDSIKKKLGQQARLLDYFTGQFGTDQKSKVYRKAQDNFCRSLAAYSLVCYVLQVKDRHNGNILIDIEGHIMHIDFGFLLSNAPGKGIKFEQAPFKLTWEMVEVLGGNKSKRFKEYREHMRLGFMAIQEHADKIIKLVEMMFMGLNDLPCFVLGENLIGALKNRILPPSDAPDSATGGSRLMNEVEAAKFVDGLIQTSYDNWRTKAYDKFQYCCQGIL